MARTLDFSATTATFRALSDPTRLEILLLLAANGEVFQKKLVHQVGANQPSVSRHLACLKRAGLIHERRSGRYVYLRMGDWPQSVVELLRHLLASGQASSTQPASPWNLDAAV